MLIVAAVALFVLGVSGFVFVHRRRFYRRNSQGVQQFAGYGRMLVTRTIEKGIRLLAALSIAGGVGCLLLAYSNALDESHPVAKQRAPSR